MSSSTRRRSPSSKEIFRASGRALPLFLANSVFLALAFALSSPARAVGGTAVGPVLTSVSVRGSVVVLGFRIPKRPAGRFLHLSVDGGRLLGRKVDPGKELELCVGHLPAGRHRLGFELAGEDQIVKTDEIPVPVVVPGGPPFSCPATGKRS